MKKFLAILFSALALAANAHDAYLFAYFSNNGYGARKGEAAGMRLAYSRDALKWTPLAGERPLLVPELGPNKLLRDPSICQGPDGVFHLVWTTGWNDRIIGHASSKDLVNWSEQQEIPVMAHESEARNCWAPEVTYNPDDGLFYIYWATTIPGRHSGDETNEKKDKYNHRIYLTTTKDWQTFTPARIWYDPPFSAIDSALLNADGKWMMVVKNENGDKKDLRVLWRDALAEGWGSEVTPPVEAAGTWVEGPSPLKAGNDIYIYFDRYTKGRYGAVKSSDGGKTWQDVSSELSLPNGIRHGTAFAVSEETLQALIDALEPGLSAAMPFADNMVLQRGRPVPVWGKASPGAKVSVSFAGQEKTAVADDSGAWRVELDAMEASKEGRELSVSDGVHTESFKNVLVGEVWFASGQSNMECPIWGGNPRYRDANGAMMLNYTIRPYIRWAKNKKEWGAKPRALGRAVWRDYSPESFGECAQTGALSAVAYYYALELYGALDVPVGIVDSSWGGTNIDAWTPPSGYAGKDELKDVAAWPVTEKWEKSMARGPVSGAHQQPSVLWNGMVAAWTPFAIRGFIWYQGCSNAREAGRYCAKMHALYDGWAKEFENPDLKLYFAELAPYKRSWFDINQAQMKFAAEEENAAIACLADVGNIHDIHPNNKELVAKRLVLHALRNDYGFSQVRPDSPTLKSWKVEDGAFVMSFNDADGWYVYAADRNIEPAFEIAGPDGVFLPAKLENVDGQGRVKGTELVVRQKDISLPCRLRYLHESPFTGTLYNSNALPLGSFEIDAR